MVKGKLAGNRSPTKDNKPTKPATKDSKQNEPSTKDSKQTKPPTNDSKTNEPPTKDKPNKPPTRDSKPSKPPTKDKPTTSTVVSPAESPPVSGSRRVVRVKKPSEESDSQAHVESRTSRGNLESRENRATGRGVSRETGRKAGPGASQEAGRETSQETGRGGTVETGTANTTGLRGATRGPGDITPGTRTTTAPGKPATAIRTVRERRTTEMATANTRAPEIGTVEATGGTGNGIGTGTQAVAAPALRGRGFQISAEAHRTAVRGTVALGGLPAAPLVGEAARGRAGGGAGQERGGGALVMVRVVLVLVLVLVVVLVVMEMAVASAVMSAQRTERTRIEKVGRHGKIGDGEMVVPGPGRARGWGEDQDRGSEQDQDRRSDIGRDQGLDLGQGREGRGREGRPGRVLGSVVVEAVLGTVLSFRSRRMDLLASSPCSKGLLMGQVVVVGVAVVRGVAAGRRLGLMRESAMGPAGEDQEGEVEENGAEANETGR